MDEELPDLNTDKDKCDTTAQSTLDESNNDSIYTDESDNLCDQVNYNENCKKDEQADPVKK